MAHKTPCPEFHFRGGHVHADIHPLLISGEISGKEMGLLLIIDSFIKTSGESCWASNEYIANKFGMCARQVQRMIAHLTEIGLVINTGTVKKGTTEFRTIETCFSRLPPRKQLRGGDDTECHGGDDIKCHAEEDTKKAEEIQRLAAKPARSARLLGPSTESSTFFKSSTKWDDHPSAQWAHGCAARLHAALVKKMRLPSIGKRGMSRWTKSFILLLQAKGNDTARVEKVLTWCEQNPTMFRIESAEGFRKYFDFFEKKAESKAPAARKLGPVPPDQLDEATPKVIQSFYSLRWPKGSASQLEAAVDASVKNYRAFAKKWGKVNAKVQAAAAGTSKAIDLKGFFRRVESEYGMYYLVANVSRWFKKVHADVAKWEGWNGDLSRYVYAMTHEKVIQRGKSIASDYGDVKLWDRMMEMVNE